MASGDGETVEGGDEATSVESVWWYLVVFAAVWGVIAWFVFVGYVAGGGSAAEPSGELTVLAMAVLVVNPIGIYLDIVAVDRSGVDWSPNARLYVAAALVGIPTTVFSTFVALAYLYRRHVNVGTP